MASEAALWVEIVPTTKGIKGKVEREFGQGFDAVEDRGRGLWGRISDGVKGVAATVTGVLGAAFTKSLVGGLGRLLNIEDAQAKLKGLGHDAATVTAIMGDALNAVRGTAFGMDAAATTAASAVAAGIKPGQELEKYLRLTADAATIAGTSMSEMGGIINKVTANGKAMTENLYQLQDRGIPIMQWLAKEYGVSAEALQKMVSEGKVDAATFRRVIEENIGGAALASGDTTRGAFANMNAALNRVGANLLSGVFPLFREFFVGITDMLAPLEAKAKELGQTIGDFVTPLFEKLAGAGDKIRDTLSNLAPVLGPVVGLFLALGAGALPGLLGGLPVVGPMLSSLLGPLSALAGPIGLILAAFAGLVAVSPELQSALGGAASAIFDALLDVGKQLAPVLEQLLPIIVGLAQSLGGMLADAITMLVPFVVQVVELFGGLLADILPVLIPIVGQLAGVVMQLLGALIPVVAQILNGLMPVFKALLPPIMELVEALLPFIMILIDALMPVLTVVIDLVSKLAAAFMPILEQILPPLVELMNAFLIPVLEMLGPIFTVILAAITPIIDAIGTALIPIIEGLAQILGGLIDFLVGVFTGDWKRAWKGIQDIFSGIWNTLVSIVEGVVNAVIGMINGMISGVNSVTGAIGIPPIGLLGYVDWSVAKLEDGAYVSARRNGILANIGEGRYDEVVQPTAGPKFDQFTSKIADRLGGSGEGFTQIVQIRPEDDPRVVGRQFGREFARAMAGG